MEKCRLVFSGSGGQGVITAAIILAEAAALYEGLVATQAQAYGPEARGGSTRSDVIISDSQIHYPKVVQPNVLICLTRDSYSKFYPIIRPGGQLITDSRFVDLHNKVDALQYELPMYDTVMEKIGKPIVFNICMLGAVVGMTELVKPESIIEVLKTRIPQEFLDMNQKALEMGLEMGSKLKR